MRCSIASSWTRPSAPRRLRPAPGLVAWSRRCWRLRSWCSSAMVRPSLEASYRQTFAELERRVSCRGSRIAAWRKAREAGSPDRLTFARAGTIDDGRLAPQSRQHDAVPPAHLERAPVGPRRMGHGEGRDERLPARPALAAEAHEPAAAGSERPRVQGDARALIPERGETRERATPDVRRRVGEQRALDRRRAAVAVGSELDERGRAARAAPAQRDERRRERRGRPLARNVVDGHWKAQQAPLEAVGLRLPEGKCAACGVDRERRVDVDAGLLGYGREAAGRLSRRRRGRPARRPRRVRPARSARRAARRSASRRRPRWAMRTRRRRSGRSRSRCRAGRSSASRPRRRPQPRPPRRSAPAARAARARAPRVRAPRASAR